MPLTGLEAVVFAVLLAVSLILFGWRLVGVLRRIRRSKPDADFKLRPILPRASRFVWEVLLQAKVIRERPWPGLAHAFVFWGFCAFALVTVNHVSEAFGWGLLSPNGFGRFYRGAAAVFAVAVAVSIVGLAARRFLVRPKWLGEVSYESGLIAFLIFALMATYLAEFGLAEGSAIRPGQLVAPHLGPVDLSAGHPAHQAPPLATEPDYGVPGPAWLQPHPAARGRRGFRPHHR